MKFNVQYSKFARAKSSIKIIIIIFVYEKALFSSQTFSVCYLTRLIVSYCTTCPHVLSNLARLETELSNLSLTWPKDVGGFYYANKFYAAAGVRTHDLQIR